MKTYNRFILSTALMFSVALSSCIPDSGGDKGSGSSGGPKTAYNGYLAKIKTIGGSTLVNIYPPLSAGVPVESEPGIDATQLLNDFDFELANYTVSGGLLKLNLTLTNVSANEYKRVWLVIKSLDTSLPVDISTVNGYYGDGYYIFLGNMSPAETAQATAQFVMPAGMGDFEVLFDIVSVADRIVFQNVSASGSEIITMALDGTDTVTIVNGQSGVSNTYPVWSPDGGWVAYSYSYESMPINISLARADGKGIFSVTCFDNSYSILGGFTIDGKKLYIKYSDGLSNMYLLDIASGLADCSALGNMTQLTDNVSTINDIAAPLVSPDGNFIFYGYGYNKSIEPPYAPVDPNTTCCADWTFGSEATYYTLDFFMLPTDYSTGLSTGPAQLFWENPSIEGWPSLTPDGKGVLGKAGGCASSQYTCIKRIGFTDNSGLVCDGTVTYRYMVRARDEFGVSPWRAVYAICGIVPVAPVTASSEEPIAGTDTGAPNRQIKAACAAVPTTPANLTYTSDGASITITWNEVAPPAGCTILYYEIAKITAAIYATVTGSSNYSCEWKTYCKSYMPPSLYKYDIPADWSGLPRNYIDDPGSFSAYDGFVINTTTDLLYPASGESPFLCGGNDRLLFTDRNHNIRDCDLADCYNTKVTLFDRPMFQISPKCMPPVWEY